MARAFNFNAGPAALPTSVLEKAQAELLDFKGTGMSVMELSHRSKEFEAVINSAEARLRKLLNISDDYAVLFLQSGASFQFSMLAANLLNGGAADYIDTGYWSVKAIKEAKNYGKVNVIYSGKDKNYVHIPEENEIKYNAGAAYVHLTSNNTIYGSQWAKFPKTSAPLIADMSSDILSRPFDMDNFACIYAGAQKNIGPSGLVVTVIRKDLTTKADEKLPTMFKYSTHVENGSMYNTPNTWGIYLADLVFEWMEQKGGLSGIASINDAKAAKLYASIDNSGGYYTCPVEKNSRSKMNVVWRLKSEEMEEKFIKEAKGQRMIGLKGHRAVGGIRASIYNAVGPDAVDALCAFMADFQKKNG